MLKEFAVLHWEYNVGCFMPRKFSGVKKAIVISTGGLSNHQFLVYVSLNGMARWSIKRVASGEAYCQKPEKVPIMLTARNSKKVRGEVFYLVQGLEWNFREILFRFQGAGKSLLTCFYIMISLWIMHFFWFWLCKSYIQYFLLVIRFLAAYLFIFNMFLSSEFFALTINILFW